MDLKTFLFWAIIIFLGLVFIWVAYYFVKVRDGSPPETHAPIILPQSGGEERRQNPRMDVNWSVSMETSKGIIATELKNISIGGAFICCKDPLPLGDVFHLTMIGPGKEPVIATAEVVWSNANVPEEKVINRGMGVRFIKMSDKHIRLVRRLFEKGN
jgi:uncharacterized protein (TIGR02266 family)